MRGSHFDGKIMFDMMTDKTQLHVSSKCYFHRIFGNEFNSQIQFDYTTLLCAYLNQQIMRGMREKCVQLEMLESTVSTAKGLIEIMYFGYNNALPQNAHFLKFVEQVHPYQL